MINPDLMYAKTHEWLKDLGNGTFEVGISDHAQDELGDLVFVNLPEVGDSCVAGEPIADVESVKAVSDINSPVTGAVSEINEALLDTPEAINQDAYAAWFYRVKDVTDKGDLMDATAYEAFLAEQE